MVLRMKIHIDRLLIVGFLLSVTATFGQKTIKEYEALSKNFFETGKYAEALILDLKVVDIAKKHNDCKELAFAYWKLGRSYYYLQDIRMALEANFNAKYYIDKCKVDTISGIVLSNIGAMYHTLGKPDSAFIYYSKTLDELKSSKNYTSLSRVYSLLSGLKLGQGEMKKAKAFLNLALENAEASNDYEVKTFALVKLRDFSVANNEINAAVNYAQSAYDLVMKSNGNIDEKIYVQSVLISTICLKSDKNLLALFNQHNTLKDSVFKAETASKVAEYKVRYETNLSKNKNVLLQSKINVKNRTIIALVIGGLLVIIFLVWRINVMKLKKKYKELESFHAVQKEKERISRDLHDNVGGLLTYVLYSLDDINEKENEKRRELISNLTFSVKDVISNLRDTIWTLNDKTVTISDFSDKLKVYVRRIFKDRPTKIVFTENIDVDAVLNSNLGLNLFRICQEIANNAFKYAEANQFEISIFSNNSKLIIEIKDDGIGFDCTQLKHDKFGLSNIKARGEEVGVNIEVKSSPNEGVSYILKVI